MYDHYPAQVRRQLQEALKRAETADGRVTAVQDLHRPDRRGDCAHCSSHGQYAHVPWPCPTALAAGIPPRPDRCARCRGLGQIPDWANRDRIHGEPKPKPCPNCPGEWPTTYPEWQTLLAARTGTTN